MKFLYGLMALALASAPCYGSADTTLLLSKLWKHSAIQQDLNKIENMVADVSTTKEMITTRYEPIYLAIKCIKPEFIKPLTHLGFDISESDIKYAQRMVVKRIAAARKDDIFTEFMIERRNLLKELLRCTSSTILQSIPDIGAGMRQVGLRLEFNPKNIIDTWDEEGG